MSVLEEALMGLAQTVGLDMTRAQPTAAPQGKEEEA
jgi:hypothetical protein